MNRQPRPILPFINGALVVLYLFVAIVDGGVVWWIVAAIWAVTTAISVRTYRTRVETWKLYQELESLHQRRIL